MSKNKYYTYIILILCAILVSSCSTKSSYGVKKVFFDGVPNPFEEHKLDLISIDSTGLIMRDSILANAKSKRIPHKPYEEEKCKTCHKGYNKNESLANNKALCYTCHDNLENQYQMLHGPVALGYCTECHSPHQSINRALLKNNDKELCFNCHNEDDVISTIIHKSIEDTSCLTCHNAHGGSDSTFLNAGSCFECHDNYTNTYANVHGPVASGLCFSCHENHTSKKQHLLKIVNNELCFNCHLQEDIYLNKTHIKSDKQNCTTCHNPHGSHNNYLLTKAPEE